MSVYARSLQVAADLVGGVQNLSEYLHVPEHRLRLWMAGRVTPPTTVFLLAVDLLTSAQLKELGKVRTAMTYGDGGNGSQGRTKGNGTNGGGQKLGRSRLSKSANGRPWRRPS